MKIILKTITLLIILICISNMVFTTYSFATNPLDKYNTDDMAPADAQEGMDSVKKIINRSLSVVQIVGFFAAVAMLVIMGMKFMLGSIEDKVEVKKHLTTYVLGASLMFGAAGVLEIVKKVIEGSLE